jgi:hypothetical protein
MMVKRAVNDEFQVSRQEESDSTVLEQNAVGPLLGLFTRFAAQAKRIFHYLCRENNINNNGWR